MKAETMVKLFEFPWLEGKKPDFVNEKGVEWYKHKSLTEHCTRENQQGITLPTHAVFYIKTKDDVTYGIVDLAKGELVYTSNLYEAIAVHIDILKVAKQFKV